MSSPTPNPHQAPSRPSSRALSRSAFVRRGAMALAAVGTGALSPAGADLAGATVKRPTPFNSGGRAPVTITFAHFGDRAKVTQLFGSLVQQFEARHPSIKVTLLPVPVRTWTAFSDAMLTRIAGGDIPDIMRVDLQGLQLFGRKNVILPLNDLIGRHDSFIEELRSDTLRLFWESQAYQGRQLALPFTWNTLALGYNTRVMPQPRDNWTGDDFLALGARLKKQGRWVINITGDNGTLFTLEGWSAAAGAAMLSADWSRSTVLERGNVVAWQFLYDLVHKYHYAPRPSLAFPDETYLTSGRLATTLVSGRGLNTQLTRDGLCAATSCFADVHPLPILGGGPRKALWSSNGFPISRASKHPEAAWEFAKFLSSAEAIGLYTRQGNYLPCRTSVAYSGRVMSPPTHYRVFYDMLRAGAIPITAPPSFLELESAATRWYSTMMAQEASPQAALAGLDRDFTAILKQSV